MASTTGSATAGGNLQPGVQMRRPPINLERFCSLLLEHGMGAVSCKGSDCAMLFGSTGAGKSTMLHLLAGAVFSFEAVEVHF